MSRERITWTGSGPTLPVEKAAAKKTASPPPAVPLEDGGYKHPASYEDPNANDYQNGDTSSWAEDPHPGPYRTSPAPADPMDDGGYKHPATQPGAPAKNASDIRVAVEKKARKCIRIAQRMLGRNAAIAAVEDQALELMDLPESHIASMLRRLAEEEDKDEGEESGKKAEETEEEIEEEPEETASKKASSGRVAKLRRLLKKAEEEEEETDDDDEKEAAKKKASFFRSQLKKAEDSKPPFLKKDDDDDKEKKEASARRAEDDRLLAAMLDEEAEKTANAEKIAEADKFAAIEAKLAELTNVLTGLKSGGAFLSAAPAPEPAKIADTDEALLAAMLTEAESEDDDDSDVEAMYQAMLSEEKSACGDMTPAVAEEQVPVPEASAQADMFMDDMIEEEDVGMGPLDDPMGLDDDIGFDDLSDGGILSSLYAEQRLASKNGEDETEDTEEKAEEAKPDEEKKEASNRGKTAAQRTSEANAAKLKPQPRKASTGAKAVGTVAKVASSDINDLSKLWESAPDVSKVFG